MKKVKFADGLKDILAELFSYTRDELEIAKSFYKINPEINNNIYVRQFMLNLGTDIVRYGTTNINNNPFLQNYINNKITKEELSKILLDKIYININISENKKIIFVNNKTNKIVFEKTLEELNEKFLNIMFTFIEKYQKELLSSIDIWSNILMKNLPEKSLSAITDARFIKETRFLLESKLNDNLNNRLTMFLVIKEEKDENGNIIPVIINQQTRLDNDLLYSLYNNATSVEELEKVLKDQTGLPPAETRNVIFTLYFIKRLNKIEKNNFDKIVEQEREIEKIELLNFPFGISKDDIARDKRIQKYFKNRKNNEVTVFLGCSENGKDYVCDSISEYQLKNIKIKEKYFDLNLDLYINEYNNIKFRNLKFTFNNDNIKISENFSNFIKNKLDKILKNINISNINTKEDILEFSSKILKNTKIKNIEKEYKKMLIENKKNNLINDIK